MFRVPGSLGALASDRGRGGAMDQDRAEAAAEPAVRKLVAIPPEDQGDRRVAVTPDSAKALRTHGWELLIPLSSGERIGETDEAYTQAGAQIVTDTSSAISASDMSLWVAPPSEAQVGQMASGHIAAGFFEPFFRPELAQSLADRGVSALALELVPRTTIAQSMDGLSSQASLAGYAAVVLAAGRLAKALPMMSTPAGTIKPARVLVVGTGVAGLQAIATAVRLGARVTAYDVRPTAKEQVESLGAKFAKIDLGQTGEAQGGYAKELTPEQLESQRSQLAKLCAESDIIVTTAQVFGRRAPVIVTTDMVRGMRPGSVVVDAAVATGGNVEPVVVGQETDVSGVCVIGDPYLTSRVARDASMVLASNFVSLLRHCFDPQTRELRDPVADEIVGGALLTHRGVVRDQRIAGLIGPGGTR